MEATKHFNLEILTSKGSFYANPVLQFNLGIYGGRIGLKANHTPLISSIKPSEFSVDIDGDILFGFIYDGIVSFIDNKATVFTTKVKWASDVNLEFVKQHYNYHKEQLLNKNLTTIQLETERKKTLYYEIQLNSKELSKK